MAAPDALRLPIQSGVLWQRARQVIPGGVNSPVRSFHSVGGTPYFIVAGAGSRIRSVEGLEWTDYCLSWGALLFGHACPEIVEAVRETASQGLGFGAATEREVELAERLCAYVPSLERVRLVSTGTEAMMTAVRLARAFTGRNRILKFSGCYHGHFDAVLVEAGSGLLTSGIPVSAGLAPGSLSEVRVVPYNDLEAVDTIAQREGDQLAAILVEPMAANMGLVPPRPGFLAALRMFADRCGALLIFDEVITGFRFGPTSFGTLEGVRADLVALGKIIGGGLPLAAVGGRADVMDRLAPVGPVYQAGTLSGNPLSVAAGLATLKRIESHPPYEHLCRLGQRLEEGLHRVFRETGAAACCVQKGGVFTIFFSPHPPSHRDAVRQTETARFAALFQGLLQQGIYLPPSPFEAAFLSAAHTAEDVETFISAARDILSRADAGPAPSGDQVWPF